MDIGMNSNINHLSALKVLTDQGHFRLAIFLKNKQALCTNFSTLCMLGNISCFCYCMLTLKKNLSGLISIQTVCKGYQQMTKVAAIKKGI